VPPCAQSSSPHDLFFTKISLKKKKMGRCFLCVCCVLTKKNKKKSSLDATLGLLLRLATRRRLGRRGDFSAMRSAFVV